MTGCLGVPASKRRTSQDHVFFDGLYGEPMAKGAQTSQYRPETGQCSGSAMCRTSQEDACKKAKGPQWLYFVQDPKSEMQRREANLLQVHTGEKAGLKCDGYDQSAHTSYSPIKTAVTLVPGRCLGRPLLPRRNPWPAVFDQRDVVYFDLFRTQLVDDLSGYLCSDFWSRIVLCECMTDTCVQESVLAIGALSAAVRLASQSSDPIALPSALHPWTAEALVNDHHRGAVCHYIKALSFYRSRVKASTTMLSPRSALIMSMLLVTFEMLQGDMKTVECLIARSITYLDDAFKIYRREVPSNHNTQIITRVQEDDMEDIEHLLPLISITSGYTPFFVSQSANTQLWDVSKGHSLPDVSQSTITRLQTQWSKFYTRASAFIAGVLATQIQAKNPSPEAEARQRVLLAQLSVWEAELDSRSAKSKMDSEPARRTLQMMQIQHLTLLICISSCLDSTELSFDGLETEFHKLLLRCATFLHETRPAYLFTLSASLTGALGTVVIRCRVHSLRMMAAALLQKLSWREGAWDASLMVYGKLGGVLLEERARDANGFIAPEHRWFWTGGEWDVERGVLVARYIRAVPDSKGVPVHTTLLLGLGSYPDVCADVGCFVDHAAQCERLIQR